MEKIIERQEAIISKLNEEYHKQLDDSMGKLHNQFVAFISAAKLPLPQALLVLEIVKRELVDQAYNQYLGDS